MDTITLHPGRDRSLRRRHPWLLSGAVARVEGSPGPGAAVRVLSAEGEILGHGHYAPDSRIRVRLLAFGKEDPGEEVVPRRIGEAVARRLADRLLAGCDAVRLINSEADGLPGLIADRYGDVVVVKLSTAGMANRREAISQGLQEATGASTGYERPDSVAARREGVASRQAPLWGEAPSGLVTIQESGRVYQVDVVNGQKTGFYLDQRDARDLVQILAPGRRMLDLFAYTGGSPAAAARAGASAITMVDSSAEALELARENVLRNAAGSAAGFPGGEALNAVKGDAFHFVRGQGEEYDLIVVDPPPLAKRRSDLPRASRAYKDVILHALRRAAPGALVLVFRCSHAVDADLFRKITFGASVDAHRPVQVLRTLGPPSDHPVSLDHPEGDYLSGLLLRA